MSAAGEVLRKAAGIVERGWCQNRLEDLVTGQVCALGAINVAATGSPYMATEVAYEAQAALTRKLDRPIPWWNDDPATTQADVVKTFLQVADEEDVK